MNYAREMMDIDWNSVLFTDEKSFWLGSTTDSAWQQRNHRIEVETSKWTPKTPRLGRNWFLFQKQTVFIRRKYESTVPADFKAETSYNLCSWLPSQKEKTVVFWPRQRPKAQEQEVNGTYSRTDGKSFL